MRYGEHRREILASPHYRFETAWDVIQHQKMLDETPHKDEGIYNERVVRLLIMKIEELQAMVLPDIFEKEQRIKALNARIAKSAIPFQDNPFFTDLLLEEKDQDKDPDPPGYSNFLGRV